MIEEKTKLILNVLGIDVSQEELERLVSETMVFEPFTDIFSEHSIGKYEDTPDGYRQLKKGIEESERSGKKAVIAKIQKDCKSPRFNMVYIDFPGGPDDNLIYSNTNPIILAHEIGHALGLIHPSPFCTLFTRFFCGKNREKRSRCDYARDIMGCCAGNFGETTGFSQSDIKFLRRKYAT